MGTPAFSDQTSLTWISARETPLAGGGGSSEARPFQTRVATAAGTTGSEIHAGSGSGKWGTGAFAASFTGTIQSRCRVTQQGAFS